MNTKTEQRTSNSKGQSPIYNDAKSLEHEIEQSLNQGQSLRAICVEAKVPEWIELLPIGDIIGRDGRSWRLNDAQGLISAFLKDNKALPIDYEHSTEIKGINGEKAPAVGWIEELSIENNVIVGRVVWTDEGKKTVANREYRYVSPVFEHTKDGGVVRLLSVGLTNMPNLHLKALNTKNKGVNMKGICKALGLAENVSEAEIVACIQGLQIKKAQNSQGKNQGDNQGQNHEQSLKSFVPRTEYDAMSQRALNAENSLQAQAAAENEKAINSEVESAIKSGKIAPASKDYFLSMCKKDNGLQEFKEFITTAPAIIGISGNAYGLDEKDIPKAGTGLSDVEKATCRALDISEADFIKEKGKE